MTSNSPSNDHPDYQHLLGEIRQRIRSAQYQALKAVNQELIPIRFLSRDTLAIANLSLL
jgi:hypothetical protein